MAHSENYIEYGGTPKVAPVCAERHAKFKAYWESIGKPVLACRTVGNEGGWEKEAAVNWLDHRDYRIAGDPHWELRREWVDSDFTLPIEHFVPSDEYGDDRWVLIQNRPQWLPEKQYRKAEIKKADQMGCIPHKPGDKMPVSPHTLVNVILRGGHTNTRQADLFEWGAIPDFRNDEIIAYRVLDPEVQVEISDAKSHSTPKYDANFAPVEAPFPVDELGVNHPMYLIFMDAIEQATGGKGQRHGGSRTPFLEQRWHRISRSTGFRSLVYQMCKKAEEACDKDDYEAFERELLGALVYGAMSLIHVRIHGFTKEVKVDGNKNQ